MRIPTSILEPAKVDISVGGVQVGGVIPWIQNVLAETRSLTFTMYKTADGKTVVAGDVQALAPDGDGAIDFETPDPREKLILKLAHAVLLKQLAVGKGSRFAVLSIDDFTALVSCIGQAAELNRRLDSGAAVTASDYKTLLARLEPLATNMPGWPELDYFGANVADRAESNETAVRLYQAFIDAAKKSVKPAVYDALVAEATKKVEAAVGNTNDIPEGLGVKPVPDSPQIMELRTAIQSRMDVAHSYYESAFTPIHLTATLPKLTIIANESFQSFYLPSPKHQIFVPKISAQIPDMIYREVAHAYLVKVPALNSAHGDGYSIESSLADILAQCVKQKDLKQNAKSANWLLYEGAIAWYNNLDPEQDRRPLRSMKAPGTAFKDAGALGSDTQVSNYSQYVKSGNQINSLTNSGISNRAFYELATRLDTERALSIFLRAISLLPAKVDYPALAAATLKAARGATNDANDQTTVTSAVRDAWRAVGIPMSR
jgi:hypothetical protein